MSTSYPLAYRYNDQNDDDDDDVSISSQLETTSQYTSSEYTEEGEQFHAIDMKATRATPPYHHVSWITVT